MLARFAQSYAVITDICRHKKGGLPRLSRSNENNHQWINTLVDVSSSLDEKLVEPAVIVMTSG